MQSLPNNFPFEPARLLDQTLQELGIRAQFTYIEGGTHFDLYQGDLTVKIANEMEAVAHPKPAKPVVTRKPGPDECCER